MKRTVLFALNDVLGCQEGIIDGTDDRVAGLRQGLRGVVPDGGGNVRDIVGYVRGDVGHIVCSTRDGVPHAVVEPELQRCLSWMWWQHLEESWTDLVIGNLKVREEVRMLGGRKRNGGTKVMPYTVVCNELATSRIL